MKNLILLLTLLSSMGCFAQGTAFTYQGRLNDGANPATGLYDLRFILFDNDPGGSQQGPILTNAAIVVSSGLFTTTLDFGANFSGANRWLEIAVRTNGGGAFMLLSPRQQLAATPYAITASNLSGTLPASQLNGTVPASALAGTYSSAVTLNNAGNSFSGNGSGLTGVNADTVGGLAATNFWSTAGNSGTSPANGNFLGTRDNQPLELRVNGLRAMRYEFGGSANAAPNVIGGSPVNFVSSGVVGAVIAGGGTTNFNNASQTNSVSASFGVIGGGGGNTIRSGATFATVGGGSNNLVQINATYATIFGGDANVASAIGAFVGGGGYDGINIGGNTNAGAAGVIGGGVGNQIAGNFNSRLTVIGGGYYNQILSGAADAVICGGGNNVASSPGAFIGSGGWDGSMVGGNMNAGAAGVIGGGVGNQIAGNFNSRGTVIGGGYYNQIQSGAADAVIGGGGNNIVSGPGSFIGGGGWDGGSIGGNTNAAAASVIGGGLKNWIQAGGNYSVIGGGQGNINQAANSVIGGGVNNRLWSSGGTTIGGGSGNLIQTNAHQAAIGGGSGNQIQTNAPSSTIGGGQRNQINANASFATIAGGASNTVSGSFGAVPGGDQNVASTNSFAAGHRAKATSKGVFVWADATDTDFPDSGTNSFNVRSSGGATFITSVDGSGNPTGGVTLAPGGTTWSTVCDQNAKKNFAIVDGQAVLQKLAGVPVEKWNYKWEKDTDVPNIGPMAQAFKAAFYPGRDDKRITTLEFDGVELAAIQGLNEKLEEQKAENKELKQQLVDLKQLVQTLVNKK